MQNLATSQSKNGYSYRLIHRTEREAVFQQLDGDRVAGFEVGRIKTARAGEVFGKFYPEREVFWIDEDFGAVAWYAMSIEKAMQILEEIQNGTRITPKNK